MATTRRRCGTTCRQHWLSRGHEDRLAADPAQDRGRRRHRRASSPPSRPPQGFRHHCRATPASTTPRRKSSACRCSRCCTGGQEVIIGAVTDPAFGKLVAFGLGGILVEVLKDITFRLAPASHEDALSMLDGIAAAEILRGVRGAEPVDRAALARHDRAGRRAGRGLSRNLGDGSRIRCSRTEHGATAADVRIVLDFNPAPARYSPEPGADRPADEPHHEAQCGGGDRRLGRRPARSAIR